MISYVIRLFRTQLWFCTFVAMILGAILGAFVPEVAPYLEPIGILFIKLIKMLIVPLVFFSIVSAIVEMEDLYSFGRKGIKSFGLYLITTSLAIVIGLFVGHAIEPGVGVSFHFDNSAQQLTDVPMYWKDVLIGIVPSNILDAFVKANVLQIIVISIFLGIAIRLAEDKGKAVGRFVVSGAEVVYCMTGVVMRFAPIGVFALISWMVASQDSGVWYGLLMVIAAVYLACGLHVIFVYGLFLRFFAKLNPIYFLSKILPAQLVAFSTTSSSATLPVTMKVTERKLGVSKGTASFVLPFGTTVNMDGTALYQGICVMFVAQALGIDLSVSQYITVILTSTLASIGTAGVPGAGLIMLSLVLSAIGLPLEAVALIAGVDRILDMARTLVNVTGDSMVAIVVDKSEGGLDEEIYYSRSDY